jgi:hypothetical protein
MSLTGGAVGHGPRASVRTVRMGSSHEVLERERQQRHGRRETTIQSMMRQRLKWCLIMRLGCRGAGRPPQSSPSRDGWPQKGEEKLSPEIMFFKQAHCLRAI